MFSLINENNNVFWMNTSNINAYFISNQLKCITYLFYLKLLKENLPDVLKKNHLFI